MALVRAEVQGGVCAAKGFAAAGVRCGMKRKRRDVAILLSTEGAAAVAGVFTTNVLRAPCITRNEQILHSGRHHAHAVVVNAGNANAGNGHQGVVDNEQMAEVAGEALGIAPGTILTASTGVIGTPMPMETLLRGIREAAQKITASAEGAEPTVRHGSRLCDPRRVFLPATRNYGRSWSVN